MKKERVVLAFIAALIGLLVAGIVFYIYQSTKTVSPTKINTQQQAQAPSQTTNPNIFLNITQPADESVVQSKIVEVAGKTKPDATVVVLTQTDQKIVSPSVEGDFSTTVNIGSGENIIEITAISPNGQEIKALRTITFSTEQF